MAGWALRSSKNFTLSFFNVWSSGQAQVASFTLEHVDPTVQIIAFKVTLMQLKSPQQNPEVFNIQVDTKSRLVNPLASKKRWKVQNGLLTTSSGSTNASSTNNEVFKMPPGLKIRLCRALDQSPNKSLNDWRALAAALRLETGYFQVNFFDLFEPILTGHDHFFFIPKCPCKSLACTNRELEMQQNARPFWSSRAERQHFGCLDTRLHNYKQILSFRFPIWPGSVLKFVPLTFQGRANPTECILTLWEVQQQSISNNNHEGAVNPLVDLLNLLRVIGRQDAAHMVEKDFGPWI